MENTTKRYWKGVEELKNDIEFVKHANSEFPSADDNFEPTHRRDFLKYLGFGVAAVSLAACDAPVRKAIPYLNKPEDVEPGIPNWYASTYAENGDYASILVKTREGRPIKIEPNTLSTLAKGTSARVQASVLSLYDNDKLKGPKKGEADTSWEEVDKAVIAALSKGGNVRIVSSSILSPSTKGVIADFSAKYPTTKHISYDANSVSGLIQANAESFGKAVVPSYNFSKAKVMVGLSADFLGTWISPLEYSKQWAETRRLSSAKDGKKEMSRHYQFETTLTTTGASADYRTAIKPSEEGAVAVALYNKVVALLGGSQVSAKNITLDNLDKCAKDLVAAKGAALVVSGSNSVAVQTVINALNALLGSYGTTIDMGTPVNYRQGGDAAMNALIDEVKGGQVSTLIFLNSNPVFDHPRGAELAEGLKKVACSVSFADRPDETASLCSFIAPAPHYLESWGDASPKQGYYSLMQPTISPIFKTRQAQSSLLAWAGLNSDYQAYLESYWKKNILNGASWTQALHDGVFGSVSSSASGASYAGNTQAAATAIAGIKAEGLELVIYEQIGMGTGSQANNPWLLEMPDPISKVTWENYAALAQSEATALGLEQGDIVELTVGQNTVTLPVLIQPGQTKGTVAVALGWGRSKAGKAANNAGVNVLPMATLKAGNWAYCASGVTLKKVDSGYKLAQTQIHNTVMGREAVIQESVLAAFQKDSKAGRYEPKIATSEGLKKPYAITLWNGHEKKNHSWGMAIDLNTCNGCGNCMVSCQAENNVAVVGKKEVARAREMHWIRLDRYYSSDAQPSGNPISDYREMEIASENPEVVFQPMMCQHCSNAPCETVCPVLATTHSSEGLNQMTYNRCVGTRYCANNCPYKVRRFNWFKYFENDDFDYNMNNDLGRMVLNPDVTVRSRGVIEKCSMCVQRIQAGKLKAKLDRRRPIDGEIQTACSQSCPTGAIIFGDMNDPESEVSKILAVESEGRSYHVLEEINVQPQLNYLTKIRNKDKAVEAKAEVKHEAAHH